MDKRTENRVSRGYIVQYDWRSRYSLPLSSLYCSYTDWRNFFRFSAWTIVFTYAVFSVFSLSRHCRRAISILFFVDFAGWHCCTRYCSLCVQLCSRHIQVDGVPMFESRNWPNTRSLKTFVRSIHIFTGTHIFCHIPQAVPTTYVYLSSVRLRSHYEWIVVTQQVFDRFRVLSGCKSFVYEHVNVIQVVDYVSARAELSHYVGQLSSESELEWPVSHPLT